MGGGEAIDSSPALWEPYGQKTQKGKVECCRPAKSGLFGRAQLTDILARKGSGYGGAAVRNGTGHGGTGARGHGGAGRGARGAGRGARGAGRGAREGTMSPFCAACLALSTAIHWHELWHRPGMFPCKRLSRCLAGARQQIARCRSRAARLRLAMGGRSCRARPPR